MLNKRTNILLEDRTFQYLATLANMNKTSVGDLVRKAIVKVYFADKDSIKRNMRKKAFENILRLRKKVKPISDKEIKEFINYGRRY